MAYVVVMVRDVKRFKDVEPHPCVVSRRFDDHAQAQVFCNLLAGLDPKASYSLRKVR